MHWPNGKIQKEIPDCIKGSCRSGIVKVYHENGQLAQELPVKNYMPHGVHRQWSEKGKLLGEFEMNNGNGIDITWNDNGTLQMEVPLKNGLPWGISKFYDEDGILIRTENNSDFSIDNYPGSQYEIANRSHAIVNKIEYEVSDNSIIENRKVVFGEKSHKWTIKFIKDLMSAGAVKIIIGKIDYDSNFISAGYVKIILTNNEVQRAKIYKLAESYSVNIGNGELSDDRSNELFLPLD